MGGKESSFSQVDDLSSERPEFPKITSRFHVPAVKPYT